MAKKYLWLTRGILHETHWVYALEIKAMDYRTSHLPQVFINLEHLAHNVRLLQELAGPRPLWPAIKANAYGHGAEIIGRYLVTLGYSRLCVANVAEAVES
jgi:alanine racemase